MYEINYGRFEELRNLLLYKKIKSWKNDLLVLHDGTEITIEMSESDCRASAGGEFKNVELDAVITELIRVDKGEKIYNGDGHTSRAELILFHNQNIIAQADCYANDGNGGYYYSVCSVVVKNVHYKICEA